MSSEVTDGTIDFSGGQDAGAFPDRIAPNKVAASINTTCSKGVLGPRPGLRQIELTDLTEEPFLDSNRKKIPYGQIFKSGKFQGAGPYVTDSGSFIMATISGIIFQIDPVKGTFRVIPVEDQEGSQTDFSLQLEPKTQRLDQYASRINWSVAGRFYDIFDYPDYPILIDGSAARRADPKLYEVPASMLGTYNNGRLMVASAVNDWTAGDSTDNFTTPNAPNTFLELLFPAAPFLGQAFSLGDSNNNNPITAMGSLQSIDGRSQIGPMFVATNTSVYAYATDEERVNWERTKFRKLILSNVGIAGPRAFANVNGDIFFMGGDRHIRTFSTAAAAQNKWSNTPIDHEVKNWIKFLDPQLNQFTVVSYFDNRVFITVNPFRADARDLFGKKVIDYAFGGLVVLEMDGISNLLQEPAPAWAGLWTGLRPMEMVSLNNELYVFSKDSNSVNSLYIMEPEKVTYDTWQTKPKQIVSRVYTRCYSFPQDVGEFGLKEEMAVLPGLKLIAGDFKMKVEKASDFDPTWLHWRTFIHKAQTEFEDFPYDAEMPVLLEHNFREVNLGSAVVEEEDPNICNPVTNEQFRYFGKMQLRITLTGMDWTLESIRLKALLVEDEQLISNDVCQPKQDVLVESKYEISDWDLYSIPFSKIEEAPCL